MTALAIAALVEVVLVLRGPQLLALFLSAEAAADPRERAPGLSWASTENRPPRPGTIRVIVNEQEIQLPLACRSDLPSRVTIPEAGRGWTTGDDVMLSDPLNEDIPLIIGRDYEALELVHSADFPGKADRLRALAEAGRLVAVPPGTTLPVARITALSLGNQDRAIELIMDGVPAWVASSYVR